jgi:hypothetical protein
MQDSVRLGALVYSNCDIQKFFNTATSIISAEGSSTMGARIVGGLLGDIPALLLDLKPENA